MLGAIKAVGALGFMLSTGLLINALEVCTLVIRPFSFQTFRKANKMLINVHWPLWVFMLEKWGNVKVKIYGEMLPQGDTMIGILNHTSDVDWIVGFAMCGRKCVLGALKVIVKTGHLIIPTFGMMEWFAEFIFVKRNWAEDRRQLEAGLDALVTYPKPFWFIVFPEGTRFSAARRDANNVWAAKNGKKAMQHVLWPRAKAFTMSVERLKSEVDCIYDVTMAFDRKVGIFDMLKGQGNATVHFHVKRFPISEVASMSEEQLGAWLDKRWEIKEELLTTFHKTGSYGLPEIVQCTPMHSEYHAMGWLLVQGILGAMAYLYVPSSVWGYARKAALPGAGVFALLVGLMVSQLRQGAIKKRPKAS